jgi:septal ring factor EnvC (AmiA/AmiB activator)
VASAWSDGPGASAAARAVLVLAVLAGAGLPRAEPLRAQQDTVQQQIERSQEELERIRRERERLRQEMDQLSTQVHAIEEEIENLERRIGTSASVVAELDAQIQAVEEQIGVINEELLRTHDRLTLARVELHERLRSVYKRGPLGTLRVLLESDSFAELIHRFKYLQLVTLHDRVLVERVSELEERLQRHRGRLRSERQRLARLRGERTSELQALESLEDQRRRRLSSYADRRSQAATRLTRLAREEERLRNLLEELERARREAEERAGRRTESTIRTADMGQLDWPVDGRILSDYGPHRTEGGTVTRDGVGIGAPAGTPVRSVERGDVVFAGNRGLYGPSVILSHGGGFYSLYLYLQDLAVEVGDVVDRGEVVGHVGGEGSPEGTHVEFQIRQPGSGGMPRPVDPVQWLRERR